MAKTKVLAGIKLQEVSAEDFDRQMREANRSGVELQGVITYAKSNWEREYSEESRSYKVYSQSNRFSAGKISNSMYGYCLDGTDQGVRLDLYTWKIEKFYIEAYIEKKHGDYIVLMKNSKYGDVQKFFDTEKEARAYIDREGNDMNTYCYLYKNMNLSDED